MKILFIAEVFPMRNSFTEHSLVSREFLTNISSLLQNPNGIVCDARLLCNNQTMDLLFKDFIKFVPSVIRLSDETSKQAEKALQDWDVAGLESWNQYASGTGDFADCLSAELLEIYKSKFHFDMLVCWGENGVFDSVARTLDIPCLHLELASTRKPFFEGRMIDCLGANGSASFKNIDIKDLEANLTPPSIDFWSAQYNIEGEKDTEVLGFDDSSLTYWEGDYTLDIFKKTKNKTALIGLQLFDDANTQRHSDFLSPLDFLQSVMPKLTEAGWDIIVKTHPGAVHRPINYIEQNKALHYAKKYENCYIYEKNSDTRNYLSLLRSVDLVVVINSSMGFESSLLGKTVVILGDALYKVENVYPTLEDIFSQNFDKKEYLRKLAYVAYFFSKYVFIEQSNLINPEYYSTICHYWERNKSFLLDAKFPVKDYINELEAFSRHFINNDSEQYSLLSPYNDLLSSYIRTSPKRGDKVSTIHDHLIFENSKSKVKLVKKKTQYNIDHFTIEESSFYLDGWAYDKKYQTPPVMLIILFENVVVHVGRISASRPDVQSSFSLTHSFFGFKFNIAYEQKINNPEVLFIFANGEAELCRLI